LARVGQARRQQRHRKLRKRLAWAGGLLALVAVCLGTWYWWGLASRDHPWENSLGMKFVPVAGTTVLFGVWDVRVRDFRAFAQDRAGNGGWEYQKGSQPFILKSDDWKPRGWEYGWTIPVLRRATSIRWYA